MNTLADMTEEERTNCIGMWCYIFERLDEPPIYEGIIAGYRESDNGRILVVVDHPRPDADKWGYGLNEVAPRFDLPRAWGADGQPPAGSDDLTLDPVTLTTEQDFEDAPEGTIIEDITDPRCVAMKIRGIWYLAGLGGAALTSEGMPACRVIRWGNGE